MESELTVFSKEIETLPIEINDSQLKFSNDKNIKMCFYLISNIVNQFKELS